MKSWFAIGIIGLCWGCHDDAVTTAYGKNALRQDNAGPATQPDVKPAVTDDYEPPLTPRMAEPEADQKEPAAEPRTIPVDVLPPGISPPPTANFYKAEDKWIDLKRGGRVAANQVIVKLKASCTEEKGMEIVSQAGGKMIGRIGQLRLYQIQVKAETEKVLDGWVAKFEKLECVEWALRNLEPVF